MNVAIAEIGGHGGRLATLLSAFALAFSGFSLYETALKTADLEVYVPPVIHYARDQGGDVELFVVPLTIANDGAQTGTVLSIELEVENLKADAEPKTKRYYSAMLGEHPVDDKAPNRLFAPLSIAGHATFSDTIRFYPAGNPLPRLVQDAGEFKLTLKLNTVEAPGLKIPGGKGGEISAITFQMTLPWISDQQLDQRRTTNYLHAKDWKPTATVAK